MVIVVIPSHAAEEASGPPIVRISQRLIDGLEHLLIEPPNPRAFLTIACLTLSFATSRRRCDRSRSLSIRSLAALTACGPTTGKPCVVMVGGAGRDGRQSHPRHACFRNRLAGGGTGSSSSGALCSRRTNARTCRHRRDRSRIPLALGVFALGPPRHLAQEACWLPPSGGGFGLLSRDGPACTRPLCVTAGVAAALRWRFKEADDSFSAARSSRACCCFRSPQWSRRLLPLSGSRRCFHLASQRFCPACHFLSVS